MVPLLFLAAVISNEPLSQSRSITITQCRFTDERTLTKEQNAACSGAGWPAPKFQRVEADNGAVFMVDLNSIQFFQDGNSAIVVFYQMFGDNNYDNGGNQFRFTCKAGPVVGGVPNGIIGHYSDFGHSGLTGYAPPKSVLGEIGRIACAGTVDAPRPRTPDAPASGSCFGLTRLECVAGKRK